MSEGYWAIVGAMSFDGFLQFSGVTLADGGYIKQEIDRMMQAKKQ